MTLAAAVGGVVSLKPPAALGQATFINAWGSDQLNQPSALAVDPAGNVYVADSVNNRVVIYDSVGTFEATVGSAGSGSGEMEDPFGLAIGPTGNIYVADSNNRIDVFNSAGVSQSTFGAAGTANGDFDNPSGIGISPTGTTYVADSANNRVEIFNSSGAFQSSIGGVASGSGNLQFNSPQQLAFGGPNSDFYVADAGNNRIQVFNSSGTYQSTIGVAGGGAGNGQFEFPQGVAVGPTGEIYVADANNDRVQIFSSAGTFQSTFGAIGAGNGQFEHPSAVAVAVTGNVYVADEFNRRIERFFDPSSWTSGTNTFTDPAVGPTSVSVAAGQVLGSSLTLNSSMGLVATTVAVGASSAGTLAVSGGGLSATTLNLNSGSFTQSSGESSITSLNFSGGAFSQSGGETTVGTMVCNGSLGSLTVSGGSLSAASFNDDPMSNTCPLIESGGNVSITTLTLSPGSQFTYQGGTHQIASMAISGGTLSGMPYTVNGGESIALTTGTISSSMMTIAPSGSIAQTGGTFSSPILNIAGTFTYSSGNIPFTITLNEGGFFSVNSTLSSIGILQVQSGGLVSGSGAITNSSAGQIIGSGTVSASVTNNGLIEPIDGLMELTGAVTNNSVITVSTGNEALFTNLARNAGSISLAGGTVDTDGQSLTNDGTISGFGALRTGGLTNNATLALAGSSSVSGSVNNAANGTIHLSGSSPNVFFGLVSNSGTLTIDAGASGTLYGPYSGSGSIVNNGTLYVDANSMSGSVTGSGVLTLGALGAPANFQLTSSAFADARSGLVINAGSALDLTNNALDINFGSAADPAATIRAYLASGYNGDTWTGSGIISSIAAANPGLYAVGYADGSRDAGTPAGANQIVIENTLAGDANLDGVVNFADLLVVAQNFNHVLDTHGNAIDWADGDFNYDGNVNFADLLLVAQNFNKQLSAGELEQLPGSFAAAWNLALADVQASESDNVPEPAGAAIFAAAALLMRRRRKLRIL
jgi:hypothetical protein